MRSPTDPAQGSGAEDPARSPGAPVLSAEIFALALLVASSLQIMENLVPRFPLFPWMRIGLSYVVILPFLTAFGAEAAFALFLARNVIALLYGGQPLTSFLIGTTAGALTLLGLGPWVTRAYRRRWIGILGASVVLASAFNLAQLGLVNATLIQHAGFYFQTGPILAWSLLSGAAVAILIRYSESELLEALAKPAGNTGSPTAEPAPASVASFLLGLGAMAGLFLLHHPWAQAGMMLPLLLLVPGRGKVLLQAWPFFFYLAWLHLLHTPGAFLGGTPVTREGAMAFALHGLRLANLMLLGRWTAQRFPWQWVRNSASPYLHGFLICLPLLSGIFKPSLEFGRDIVRNLAAGKRKGILAPAFAALRRKLEAAAAGEVRAESGS